MDSGTHRASDPIRLGFDDRRQVVITPETMGRFVLPAAKAVAACVNQAQFEAFERAMRQKFQELCGRIGQWCAGRPEVSRALYSQRDGDRYLLLLVVKGDMHDFQLDDPVSDFDMELYRDFPEFPTSVMTVPQQSATGVSAVLDPQEAFEIYADTSGTPSGG